MKEQYRQVGFFWLVWDILEGYTRELDSHDDKIITTGDYMHLDADYDKAWEEIREAHNYPKKSSKHYPHGEIVFDTRKCKFRVFGTQKIIQSSVYQKRIINYFGLSTFTIFDEHVRPDFEDQE